jgi:hypothetical protein
LFNCTPFQEGTCNVSQTDAPNATAEELAESELDQIRWLTWHYLDVFDYKSFHLALKRALQPGGTGFVGAKLARKLLVRGNHQAWRIQAIAHEVRLHEMDVRDSERLTQLLNTLKPD